MSAQLQVTGEAKIRDLQGPVVANSGVITALDGAANQYVRGDGTLASFPTFGGGGSSVSYYLNGSVNQGTFGGSTYYQMSKNAIVGTGTNFSTSSNGLIAQFITDANDPDVVSIPSGNWNIEFFMSVSASSGALASFYVEIYKYDGSTFTLLATNVATPEQLTNTTTTDAYFTSVAMPLSAMALTDRLAVRIYANVASKTVTLYTEDNRLCQVITTFSKGIISINGLTDQSQNLTVGTAGTNFNIDSTGDIHTFNLPVASATNTGKLSSTDWSTFNNKVPYTGAIADVDLGNRNLSTTDTINTKTLNASQNAVLGGATIGGVQVSGVLTLLDFGSYILDDNNLNIYSTGVNSLNIRFGESSILYKDVKFSSSLITNTAERTFTFPDLSGTLALLEGSQTFSGAKTFSGKAGFTNSNGTGFTYGIGFNKGFAPTGLLSSAVVNLYSDATDNNIVIKDNLSTAKLVFDNSTQTYTFPASTGTIALLEANQTFSGFKQFTDTNGTWLNYGFSLIKGNTPTSLGTSRVSVYSNSGDKNLVIADDFSSFAKLQFQNTGNLTYTFPASSGTVALTSNLSSYVPYTGATSNINLGLQTILAGQLISGYESGTPGSINPGSVLMYHPGTSSAVGVRENSTLIYPGSATTLRFRFFQSTTSNEYQFIFNAASLTLNTPRTYTLPDASGTLALTSNIPSVSGTSGQVTYFNGTSSVTGSSNHFWDATNNRLGIGTNNPQRALEIYSATADSHLRLSGSAPSVSMGEAVTGSVYQAKFGLATASGQYVSGAVAGDFIMLSQTGATIFATGVVSGSVTEKMRLTSGGNLLLGTTSDNGAKLQVNGNATVNNALNTEAMNVGGTLFLQTTADGSIGGKIYGYNDTSVNLYSSGLKFQTRYFNGSAYVYRDVLNIASTGAATFSSSVTATDNIFINGSGNTNIFFQQSGTTKWIAGYVTSINAFRFSNGSSDIFTLANSGAATFSSSVTATQGIFAAQNGNASNYNYLIFNNLESGYGDWNFYKMGSNDLGIGYGTSAGSSYTNAITFKYGGNVGIGTSSPDRALTVNGQIGVNSDFVSTKGGTTFRLGYEAYTSTGGVNMFTESAIPLVLGTSSTERMRITSGGVLIVNATSSPYNARVFVNTNISAENGILVKTTADSGDYGYLRFVNASNQQIGGIFQSSSTTLNYATSSDYRLKQDLKDFNGLDIVSAIKTYDYEWKVDQSRAFGVLAHELQEVIPYAVNGEKDGIEKDGSIRTQGVDYSKIVPILVKAIQEQQAQIEGLSNKIVALESK